MWLIGVVLSITASMLSSLGVIVQKKGFDMEAAAGAPSTCSGVVWGVGVCMMISGSATDLAAFGFAALSLLAPLDGLSMCVNAFVSQCFLGKPHDQP